MLCNAMLYNAMQCNAMQCNSMQYTSLIYNIFGDSKSQRASKFHYWFKSCGDFAEWVDFAYWWSFIAAGSAIKGANPPSLFFI